MNPSLEPDDAPPSPRITKRSAPSLVWLIPLITALIGGWLVVKTLAEQGPRITITFHTAEGLEAGKTKIRYKNMEIGLVESLRFSDDFASVIVTAEIHKEASAFLRRETRFWVVKPRLGLRGVSGLSTLISGSYIEIEPGEGAAQHDFIGLESPPVIKADQAGQKIVLMAKKLGSIDTGSPVYYQGILAGEVLGHELGNDRKSVFIHAFIKAPYDELVRGNTRFWNVSGVDLSVDADGINMRTESLQSVIFGGIAFDTPDTLEPVEEDVDGIVFTLHDSHKEIEETTYTKKIKFVLFFDGSVRGLSVGAPVEFKGIKVGAVSDIRLEFDSRDTTFRIPVIIEIEPERVIDRGEGVVSPYQTLKTLVERGLRAKLQTGSLLTGQLFVELDMRPDTEIRLVEAGGEIPELPTIPAELEEITGSIKGVLVKLEQVDFDTIGNHLAGALKGADTLLNAPETLDAVREAEAALRAFKSALRKLDGRVEPITANTEAAIASGHQALEKLQVTLDLANGVLRQDSPTQYRFNQMTEELSEMARSIRSLVDLLERDPQSLLFGKTPSGGK